jgi:hypothetical protein
VPPRWPGSAAPPWLSQAPAPAGGPRPAAPAGAADALAGLLPPSADPLETPAERPLLPQRRVPPQHLPAAAWPHRTLHVEAGAAGVAVWLRDAQMTPRQALGLLEQLARACAGAAGTAGRPRLTVNGHPVQYQHALPAQAAGAHQISPQADALRRPLPEAAKEPLERLFVSL